MVDNGTKLANGKVLIDAGPGGSPDGFRVDVDGNLWCGWGMGTDELDGVRIFNPEGKPIGHIDLPERCANVCFGGRYRNRLFMAASHSLYALYVNTQGAPAADPASRMYGVDSRYAWWRLAASVTLSALGASACGAWWWSSPTCRPSSRHSRADVSFSYTTTMLGFGAGSILLGRLIDTARRLRHHAAGDRAARRRLCARRARAEPLGVRRDPGRC